VPRAALLSALSILLAGLLQSVVLNVASGAPRVSAPWRGDFETGNLSQWDWGLQAMEPSRATIVTAPHREGTYAARFEVRPGDNVSSTTGGERTELLISSPTTEAYEGQEQFWAWSTYFPSDFDAPRGSWNVFTQFHHAGISGQSNIHFAVREPRSRIELRVMGGDFEAPARKDFVLALLTKGRWYDFVFHVKWSSHRSVGFVEVWVNRQRVVPKTSTPTLYEGQSVYLKQGYYRAPYGGTSVVYHDGMRRGSTFAEVAGLPLGAGARAPE
jgi:hypothetical protein